MEILYKITEKVFYTKLTKYGLWKVKDLSQHLLQHVKEINIKWVWAYVWILILMNLEIFINMNLGTIVYKTKFKLFYFYQRGLIAIFKIIIKNLF